ncbi:MAG: hypothetical protein RIR11_1731 [Bacteroidota bacterium]|jgi:CHAT domain-containing protein
MRYILITLLCTPFFALAQTPQPTTNPQVDSLILVSRDNTSEQNFEQALATSAAAEQLARACCGTESLDYGNACFNQGRVRYFTGDFDDALPWYLQSKDIRKKILGDMHPDYGKSLNNTAVLYEELGLYKKAELLYLEALNIREKTAGKESATYAATLGNLSSLYENLGEYEQAEKLGIEAKNTRERILGKEHPDYATILNNLANLYYDTGNYPKAEAYYLESKTLRETAQDTESEDYLAGLDNLGALYYTTDNFELAEMYYTKVLNMRKKMFGETNANYLLSLNHLAELNRRMRRWELSDSIFTTLIQLSEQVLGKEHLDYARYLQSYAQLFFYKEEYATAITFNLEAKAILEKHVGKDHILYLTNLGKLLRAYFAMKDFTNAKLFLEELSELKKHHLLSASRYMSERELYLFTEDLHDNTVKETTFIPSLRECASTCYDNILFYKGFLLNGLLQKDDLIKSHPETADISEQLQALHRQLGILYALPSDQQGKLAALEEKANALEKVLVAQITGLDIALKQVNWQEVQAQLQLGEAAVEFTRYPYYAIQSNNSMLYAAVVLLPNATQPIFIPLFEEQQLAALFQTNEKPSPDFINTLYKSGQKDNQLYQFIWQPLEAALAGVHTVYHAPDGLLHRLNLGAIPNKEGKTMAESYRLVALSSTRQLVTTKQSTHQIPASPTALLYGGITYESNLAMSTPSSPATELNRQRGFDFAQTDSTLRGNDWKYLPWTKVEINEVGDLLEKTGFSTTLYNGLNATEESIKAINSPSVLHLATHGYFFPDPKAIKKDQVQAGAAFKLSEYPMIRAGMILAVANHAWKTGIPLRPNMEDGILTAYEASQLHLKNTELVVLSACETGLGEIQSNEGVYGLQRAFKIAGARYLIMSLWQVPDFQAQVFMTAFYTHWLEDKQSIPDAFRAAQSDMRTQYGDPFLWAGFVLVE